MLSALTVIFSLLTERYKLLKRFLCVEKDRDILAAPSVYHKVIQQLPGNKIYRILFIGDVHGCFDELQDLLKLFEVDISKEDTFLVFVGDIVNKGPKSIDTLHLVRCFGRMAVCVRGNHEQAVLYRLEQLQTTSKSLSPKYSWLLDLTNEDKKYFKELPFTISLPFLNIIVVHGGLVPGVKLGDQIPGDMINMRNYVSEDQSGSYDIDRGLPWASQWPGPEFVIFGHDARRLFQRYKHALGLDTGCLYGRKLTGFMVNIYDQEPIKNGQLKSVHAHKAYVIP